MTLRTPGSSSTSSTRCPQSFLGELERGRANPTLTTLAALCDALGVRLVDLLAIETDRPRTTSRQAMQAREALASLEAFVEWAVPPVGYTPRTKIPKTKHGK